MSYSLEKIIPEVLLCICSTLELNDNKLSDSSSLGEFSEWNSLGHINIYFALQKHFNINIPLDSVATIKSVRDWSNIVLKTLISK